MFFEFFVKVIQRLWNDLYVRNNRHKVCITVPARYNMEVEVTNKASPADFPKLMQMLKPSGFIIFVRSSFMSLVSSITSSISCPDRSEISALCLLGATIRCPLL